MIVTSTGSYVHGPNALVAYSCNTSVRRLARLPQKTARTRTLMRLLRTRGISPTFDNRLRPDSALIHVHVSARVTHSSASWPSNLGRRAATSDHCSLPLTRLTMAATISSRLARTCSVESRSRRVNVLSLTDWKSMVIPRGVPSSSLRCSLLALHAFRKGLPKDLPSNACRWRHRSRRHESKRQPPAACHRVCAQMA